MNVLNKKLLVIMTFLVIIMGGSGYAYYQKNSAPEKVSVEAISPAGRKQYKQSEVTIYITGAVMHPGVVKIPSGTRVIDAIDTAGGLTPAADVSKLNLAQSVRDGMHIKVPDGGVGVKTKNEAKIKSSSANQGEGGKININTAGKSELDKLPGIGPTLAERIIDYRKANGPFKEPADLKKVSGINESRFNKFKDRIDL